MAPTAQSLTLHQCLRQRTATKHAALERTPLMQAFSEDTLLIPVYGNYLCLQWQLHAPIEALLSTWLPADWCSLRLRKSDWLLQDLQAIGVAPPPCLDIADGVGSWAQALGVLYVLEGSTLGLQVVRKQIQAKHPSLQPACRFMLGYGAETGRHWRDFLMQLDALGTAKWPLVEDAAAATFDHFLKAFSLAKAQR